MTQENNTKTNDQRHRGVDILIVIALGYWVFSSILNKLLTIFIDDFYSSPARFIIAIVWIFFAFTPFAFAFGIKNKTTRIVGLILAFILFAFSMYQQVEYLIYLVKDVSDTMDY